MEHSNKFSVGRAIAYGKLFSPWIQRQLLFYPVISTLVAVLSVTLGLISYGMVFIVLLSFIPAIMIYFGSLIFGVHSDRYIETLVPATWVEKASFTVVYSLIVLPLLVVVPAHIVLWVAEHIPSVSDGNSWLEVKRLSTAFSSGLLWNIMQSIIPAAVCLFALIVYSSRRILMAVVWSIVSLIGISIIGGVIGFMSAVRIAKDDMESIKYADPEQIIDNLATNMQPSFIILGTMGSIAVLLIIWLIFRKFKRRQI